MTNWQNIIEQQSIRLLDHSESGPFIHNSHPALTSFALDDALATSVGNQESPPTIRLWVHDKTVVLGIPDTRLPFLNDGVYFINHLGFTPIVRNSGGLAVALDKGVLNLSLILPSTRERSIHSSYDLMFDFIKSLLQPYTTAIKAYEIVGSYCPGDYDLSINGVKFAGISQRRIKNGISVQIYLDICGNSLLRAGLVRDFYDISRRNESTRYDYPNVDPKVMGSLSEILNMEITVIEIINRVKTIIKQANKTIVHTDLSPEEHVVYNRRLQQMIKRNEIITNLE